LKPKSHHLCSFRTVGRCGCDAWSRRFQKRVDEVTEETGGVATLQKGVAFRDHRAELRQWVERVVAHQHVDAQLFVPRATHVDVGGR